MLPAGRCATDDRPTPSLRAGDMSDEFTRLLADCADGRSSAAERLFPFVYDALRALAAELLQGERRDHTLQPTALVHEAFVRMVDQRRARWRDRAHFFAIAALAMRRILVEHARARNRIKRGGGQRPVPLEDNLVAAFEKSTDLLALNEALEKLDADNARAARIVELHYFGGLTVDEAAAVLEVSPSTVERELRFARAWLYREITLDGGAPGGQSAP